MGRAVVLRIEPPLASRPYGRPSLTPPAWTGLRAPLARVHASHGDGLAVPTPYHGVLAVKGLAPSALAAVAVFDPVTACAAPCWARLPRDPRSQEAAKPPLLLSGVAAHP